MYRITVTLLSHLNIQLELVRADTSEFVIKRLYGLLEYLL